MRKNYLERVKENIVLFDGAMGTMLYEDGIPLSSCFEELCVSSPEIVQDIHRKYIASGAHVIETNSFGANPIKLKSYQLEDRVEDINRASVRIARDVAGSEIYVAGSVGPLGERVAPFGKIEKKTAEAAFEAQISALMKEDIDLIILETFRDIDELLMAARVAERLNPDMPVQAQFSMGPLNIEEYHKEAPGAAKRLNRESAIDIIGINCAVGPDHLLEILMAVKPHVSKPLSVMPNAGLPRQIDNRNMYLASPVYFGNYALKFYEAGASVIGGCCGTTPEHIKKAAQMVLSIDSGFRKGVIENTLLEADAKDPVPLEERSALGRALARKEWIATVELVPPIGCDLSGIINKSAEVKKNGVLCVNLPDGPRASSRVSVTVTALEIERQAGVETIPHICCRDKNLIGLQAELLGAQAAGLRNLLIITGDPPKVGNYPDVTGVFDVDAVGLISLARRLNCGIDLGGKELPGPTSFVIGAGANPVSTGIEREIERAYAKAEAGADYFITQPVFDADQLLSFLERIRGTKLPVIAGIWPLASYRNALFLNNEVPGVTIPEEIMKRMEQADTKEAARREGILIAREILDTVRSSVAGVQVSPPFGRIESAVDVIREDF